MYKGRFRVLLKLLLAKQKLFGHSDHSSFAQYENDLHQPYGDAYTRAGSNFSTRPNCPAKWTVQITPDDQQHINYNIM